MFKQYKTYKLIINGQAEVINRQVNDFLSTLQIHLNRGKLYIDFLCVFELRFFIFIFACSRVA